MSDLTPRCRDCGVEVLPDRATCAHQSERAVELGCHDARTVAQRLIHIEALLSLLVDRERERIRRAAPRASKRSRTAIK